MMHDGFACAILFDAINIHLRGADHEIHMIEADVAARGDKLLVGQLFAADEGEAVGASDGDMAGGVFVEERVVEYMSAFGNRRTRRDERHFAEPRRTFVGVNQFL